MRFIYRPIRVTHLEDGRFEIFNTTGFSEGSRYELTIRWNDGSAQTFHPEVGPLQKITMSLVLGQPVDGVRTAVERGDEAIRALAVRNGAVSELTLLLPGFTAEEREIVLSGCLMNWYARRKKED